MITNNDLNILRTAIEVAPLSTDDFLKVCETLTRMGVVSYYQDVNGVPILWQSCHLLHKQGRYFIVHFKHLFLLDGKTSKTIVSHDDIDRLKNISKLLMQWKLITPLSVLKNNTNKIKLCVLSYSEKSQWKLMSKYTVGERHDRS